MFDKWEFLLSVVNLILILAKVIMRRKKLFLYPILFYCAVSTFRVIEEKNSQTL